MSLTQEQQAVINHPGGHAKVMAVAGAGKTTTLVYFVRQCLSRGVMPRRMLVLMYNKAAQQDFQRKLTQLLGNDASPVYSDIPEVRTFHSLGLRIYNQLIKQGHLPSFQSQLLSNGEIESAVWKLLQESADQETAKDILDQKSKWVEPAVNFIELVKSTLSSPEEVFESCGLPTQCRFFSEVFTKFEVWRKDQRRISFSDMLYDPCILFKKEPSIAQKFAGHMQQIIVDEYQDINEIQQFFITSLRGDRGDLMVVGDPDQTIYEFRGSRPEFMTTVFDRDFEGVHLYSLSNTFRYGHRLSLLCNHLISKNPDRDGVLCVSHLSTPQTELRNIQYVDYAKETAQIIEQESKSIPLTQITILNRIWAISAPIELALLEHDIPYRLDHSVSVLDRYELAPFEALLSIAAGNYADLDIQNRNKLLITLLTSPYPKVRRTVLQDIARSAVHLSDQPGVAIRKALPENLSNRQADQLLARSRVLDDALSGRFSVDRLLQKYFDTTDMEEGIRDGAFSAQQVDDRLETIKAFIRYSKNLKLGSNEGWAHWQSLREKQQSQTTDGVRLTSMHRAKGLEWRCVIIPGLSERFMPYRPEGELTIPSSVESERRLLYVAMTRAKETLYLLTPMTQSKLKVNEGRIETPFFTEMGFDSSDLVGTAIEKNQNVDLKIPLKHLSISSDYLSTLGSKITLQSIRNTVPSQDKLLDKEKGNTEASLPLVLHQTYGCGVVLKDESRHWVIRFDDGTEKQFDKRVASQYLEFLD